jgi:TPR repeat protein/AcrR family transcriptional regulator
MSDPAEQSKNDDQRTALLAAARVVMARDGGKFTIRSICEQAGISRADFNTHFSGKMAVMAAVMGAPAPAIAAIQPAPPAPPVAEIVQAAPPPRPADSITAQAQAPETPSPATSDAWLERRLRVFERALTALEAKAETSSRDHARAIALLEERLAAAQTVQSVPVSAPVSATAKVVELHKSEPVIPAERLARVTHTPLLVQPFPAQATPPQSVLAEPPQPAPAEAVLPEPIIDAESQTAPQDHQDEEIPEIEVAPESGMVLLIPEPPSGETVSRKEMAEVLASARKAVRNAAEDDAEPQGGTTARLRWIAAGLLGLVAISVCVGLTIGGSSRATATIQRGAGVMHRQMAVSSFSKLMARADSGDAKAEAELAFAYLRGDGVGSNSAQAFRWANEAAVHGEPVAQYLLGTLYQQGQKNGAKADPGHAFQLFSASAAQGNIKAMHNLAIAYAEGLGIAKDESQAAQWFERAASHGYVDSAFDLAVLYERGQGVRQSLTDALRWYSIAAMAGDKASADRASFLRHQVSPKDAVLASNAAASFAPLAPISAANKL